MELAVAADVVVDLATKDDLDTHHKRLERILPSRPAGRYYTLSAAGANTVAQPGPTAIAFTPMSPPAGRMWFIQWFAIWQANTQAGLLGGAIANLFAALCVGRSPVGGGGPTAIAPAINGSDIVMPGLVVPSGNTIPDKTVVKSQQQLYVLIGGSGLSSVTYNATAGVIDVPDDGQGDAEAYFW
jgi:hypothetical protein